VCATGRNESPPAQIFRLNKKITLFRKYLTMFRMTVKKEGMKDLELCLHFKDRHNIQGQLQTKIF